MPASPATAPASPPREVIFVIDTSGSMHGASIEQARSAVEVALGWLHPEDAFNIIQFNSWTHQAFPASVPATQANLQTARDYVRSLRADGGTEMLPALLAALDGWFRARRRHVPVGAWAPWLAIAGLPVVVAWLWLRVLGLTGAVEVPDAPVAPEVFPPGTAGVVALASAAVVAAVGWFGVRPLLLRRAAVSGNPAAGGLAAATGLLTNGVAAAAWMFNPYAAALLLPAAHLWLLAAAPGSRMRRGTTALAVAAGLALPVVAVVHYARAFGLGPLDLAWLGGMVFANGHVSLPAALATALWLAALSGVVTAVRARRRVEAAVPPQPLRTRGPRNYAGPGSLGGTESALRR
jgi:hypothetical protein